LNAVALAFKVLAPQLHTLGESDFVALRCPLNDHTRGLIGTRALAHMQRHAVLINTGRGEVVDAAALIDALRSGRIAGAGIDVFAREPPASDNPLLGLDNVILGHATWPMPTNSAARPIAAAPLPSACWLGTHVHLTWRTRRF